MYNWMVDSCGVSRQINRPDCRLVNDLKKKKKIHRIVVPYSPGHNYHRGGGKRSASLFPRFYLSLSANMHNSMLFVVAVM